MQPVRRHNQETKLILGCGNATNSDEHEHTRWYSIDPDVSRNPSVVGRFGVDSVAFLPPGSFDTIWFEGFLINAFYDPKCDTIYTENVCTISSLLYLLKHGGNVRISDGRFSIDVARKQGSELQSIDDECLLFCTDNDYLAFHNYCDKKFGYTC